MLTCENPIEYNVFLSQYFHEDLYAMGEAMKGYNPPVPLKPSLVWLIRFCINEEEENVDTA